MAKPADAAIRIDKWLWQARFFRSRALAAALVEAGRVRVNGTRITKPGRSLRAGDVLTFAQGDRVRLVRVLAPGDRRGPAAEAQGLYIDLDGSLQPQHDRPAALE
ncbi:MAG: RNA-binding S4 domain-containing protein [Gemmobacter sp.]